MKHTTLLIALLVFAMGCGDFSKSTSTDLLTGLTTNGDGLFCADVFLTVDEDKVQRNTFKYGETFHVNFNDIDGFIKEGESVFPGMMLYVISQTGDTVMRNDDLYESYTDGVDLSPLLLHSFITTAKPMKNGQTYSVYMKIWDKKGTGTFIAEMDFDIVPNDLITIKSKNLTYDNVYLFSEKDSETIVNNKVKLNDNIYLLFEGLEGFLNEDGAVYPGLSIIATDASGEVILDETDLVGDTDMSAEEVKEQLAPNFSFSGTELENPIFCEVKVWDKKSENMIEVSFDLEIE